MPNNVEPLRFEPKDEDIVRPLVVPIDGVDYPVGGELGRVTTEMLNKTAKIGSEAKPGDNSLIEMVATMLCVDPAVFADTDFRTVRDVNTWITEQVMPETKKGKKKAKKKLKK